jgi:hypothetical protein
MPKLGTYLRLWVLLMVGIFLDSTLAYGGIILRGLLNREYA